MSSKFKQICGNCAKEVDIENKQEVQSCPLCGKPLTPCSICEAKKDNYFDGCKAECPFKVDYLVKSKNGEKVNRIFNIISK